MNIITYNVRGLGRGGEMGSNKEIDQKRKCRYFMFKVLVMKDGQWFYMEKQLTLIQPKKIKFVLLISRIVGTRGQHCVKHKGGSMSSVVHTGYQEGRQIHEGVPWVSNFVDLFYFCICLNSLRLGAMALLVSIAHPIINIFDLFSKSIEVRHNKVLGFKKLIFN